MGVFDTIGKGVGYIGQGAGTIVGGATRPLAGALSGSEDMQKRLDDYIEQQRLEREQSKANQLALIGQLKAPEYSPEYMNRIKALEDESKMTPLVEDPLFQGDRATLVHGGQEALSGVQNVQRGHDVSGGFSNTGSASDIYDRMGAQLAGLGQKSRAVKEQKRDVAAQSRQQMVDAKTNYDNAIIQAKSAIEAGDAQMAMAMIDRAYQAREGISAAERQMMGQLISIGGTLGGAAMGAPATAPPGGGSGGAPQAGPQNSAPSSSGYNVGVDYGDFQSSYSGSNRPYYSMR